jgi:hypothetical protein
MSEKERRASYLRLSAAYRGLTPLEQALKMNEEEGIGRRIAAKVCNVGVGTIERAITAKAEGRNIGVNGRPRLLPSQIELALVKEIEEAESTQQHLTLEQVQMKVCDCIFYF